jgi:hypothetical protein
MMPIIVKAISTLRVFGSMERPQANLIRLGRPDCAEDHIFCRTRQSVFAFGGKADIAIALRNVRL